MSPENPPKPPERVFKLTPEQRAKEAAKKRKLYHADLEKSRAKARAKVESKRRYQQAYLSKPGVRESNAAAMKRLRATPEHREKNRLRMKVARAKDPKQRETARQYAKRWRAKHPEYKQRHALLAHQHAHDGLGGKVYFIQTKSGPVKIGFTKKRAFGRMRELQVGNHEKLTLLGWFLGTMEDERSTQERFFNQKIRGEWFLPTEELLEAIAARCHIFTAS